jgi:ribosomal protein L15
VVTLLQRIKSQQTVSMPQDRQNTIRCIFTGNQQKPNPAEIHKWTTDTLQLTIDQLEAIQLDTLEGAVYIKLSRRYHMDKLLTTSGKLFLHRRYRTQTEITIVSAETHIVQSGYEIYPWEYTMTE